MGNISTRSFVQTGDNVMIGGFVVQGTTSFKRVIIRAIGPELAQHGVPNPMADPTLELHNGNGDLIASNDNWQTTDSTPVAALVFAPCGVDHNFNINTELRVNAGASNKVSFIEMGKGKSVPPKRTAGTTTRNRKSTC